MARIKINILHSKPVKATIGYLQQKQFPGYPEISWYAVIEFFIRWIDKRDLHIRASSLSYTFFLALFPSVIFFFTLIAYLPLNYSTDEILFFIEKMVPANTFKAIKSTLHDILRKQRSGLLSVGFLFAIYFSTNGFHSLMNILNKYSRQKETRSFWKQRLVAIILSVIVSMSLLSSVLLITVGNYSIQFLHKLKYFPSIITPVLLFLLNYGIVIFIILFFVSCIYYFAPSKSRKWRFFSAGAIFACASIIITTTLFSIYVNAFNSYNKVYGSIGVLIVILLLIYINTYILLMGFELNVAIDKVLEEIRKGKVIKANRVVILRNASERNEESDI